jgi:hypothetical protein
MTFQNKNDFSQLLMKQIVIKSGQTPGRKVSNSSDSN